MRKQVKTKSVLFQTGFTLLELIIGSAVLVVAIVGLIAAFANCFTLNESARNLTVTINNAQEKIEEIHNLPFDQIVALDGTNFEIAGLPDNDSEGTIEIDSSNPNLLEITVTVCWRQKSGRIFGEDDNLNGSLDLGEDKNGNGDLDSPTKLITLIASRW
ncbi:MAG: hypothetical protein KJ957_05550 [Candidatus Omnitrophica bacterium]|nr:hypothetical protein [Candidatus Omnitrophota bacterium]